MSAFQVSSALIRAEFTLRGTERGLGSFDFRTISVPAFGPQMLPLGERSRFGVSLTSHPEVATISSPEKGTFQGWTRCLADRESWLFFSATVRQDSVHYTFKMLGNDQVRIIFYVQAQSAALDDGALVQPGELRGYEGVQSRVTFNSHSRFTSKEPTLIQIIPLSGGDCFWNANFLLSFQFSKKFSVFDTVNLTLD